MRYQTILTDISPANPVLREEISGPVALCFRVKNSDYGRERSGVDIQEFVTRKLVRVFAIDARA